MPPCSGYFFARTETASASGTKKASQASTHSSTDGAPARAPREIQRRPVTATTVKKTMSQRPRTRFSSGCGGLASSLGHRAACSTSSLRAASEPVQPVPISS